VHIKPTN